MDAVKHEELKAKLRDAVKDHQREGLNIVGNVDQLVHRLVRAVEEWLENEPVAGKKSA
jgi:hypothetical protein